MQPILAPSPLQAPHRAPAARPSARHDFARHLAEHDVEEETDPAVAAADPLAADDDDPEPAADLPDPKLLAKPEAAPPPALLAPPALLQELLLPQELPKNLPAEIPELPADLQITVRRGPMPAGPRLSLDLPSAPPPKNPEKIEILAESLAPPEPDAVPEVTAEPGFTHEEPDREAPQPPAPELHLESAPLPQTRESPVAPAERPEMPELAAHLPTGLNLEIRDPVGRWELGVVRDNTTVHLEFHGDPELRRIVQDSSREIGQRLAVHGDSLGSVQWRPIASSASAQDGRNESQQERRSSQEQPQPRQQKERPPEPKNNNKNARRALRVI